MGRQRQRQWPPSSLQRRQRLLPYEESRPRTVRSATNPLFGGMQLLEKVPELLTAGGTAAAAAAAAAAGAAAEFTGTKEKQTRTIEQEQGQDVHKEKAHHHGQGS